VRLLLLGVLLTALGCRSDPLADGQFDEWTCSSCHGGESNAAPPTALNGDVDASSPGVGAHQAHLVGGRLRDGVACTECHHVPGTVHEVGHLDPRPADLDWGSLATAGGAAPAFNRNELRCAGTYCHGGTLSGGLDPDPVWNQVGQGESGCGWCHGAPPPAPHPAGDNCNKCHPDTVAEDGGRHHPETHLDCSWNRRGGVRRLSRPASIAAESSRHAGLPRVSCQHGDPVQCLPQRGPADFAGGPRPLPFMPWRDSYG